jgi:hypothetical protein
MTDFRYVIDSSVIIRRSIGQKFDLEKYPQIWENFENKIHEGVFVSVPSVKTEIYANNKDALRWPKENNIMFKVDMADPRVVNNHMLLSAKFPNWFLEGTEKTTWADPELIAFAMAHEIVLVTCEKCNINSIELNHRIPTICSKLGAYCNIRGECSKYVSDTNGFQCIDFEELIKRENLAKS